MKVDTILIVDDDTNFAESVKSMLESKYRVQLADSGESAISAIISETPSLVLLDIGLPGIDGIETLRLIKDIDAHIPVVIVSGSEIPRNVILSYRNGATDFLYKPFSSHELMSMVASILLEANLERTHDMVSIDTDRLINEAIDYALENHVKLSTAVRNFRAQYISMILEKHLNEHASN